MCAHMEGPAEEKKEKNFSVRVYAKHRQTINIWTRISRIYAEKHTTKKREAR